MHVTVNGETTPLADGASVESLVTVVARERSTDPRRVAAAVNGEVVPRSRWSEVALRPGDRVELLTAAAGG